MRTVTRTKVNRRTGEVVSTEVPSASPRLERESAEMPRQAIEREEKRDRIMAKAAEAEAKNLRPGFGLPGKATLDPAPMPKTSPRDALRTRSGATAKRRAGNTGGAVDLSTVTRKAPVTRTTTAPEVERMRALMVKLTDASMHLYPSECGAMRAEIKELASYFRHDVEKLAILSRLDERCKRVQYSVH